MKEKYEYLIDEYGVELVVNSEYAAKNNLHSLKLVKEHLENSYIVAERRKNRSEKRKKLRDSLKKSYLIHHM